MENYEELIKELIEQEIGEYTTWNKGSSREDAIKHMSDNGFENLFGNIDGSRTYSTYEAQKFIEESGAIWDTNIHELFSEIKNGYFEKSLARGAETLDVIICELLGQRVLYEIAEAEGIEL